MCVYTYLFSIESGNINFFLVSIEKKKKTQHNTTEQNKKKIMKRSRDVCSFFIRSSICFHIFNVFCGFVQKIIQT